jgi:exopolyphosphatase / guanosine-5'-triphosphate,3'-diphosphate pyrophosphatase
MELEISSPRPPRRAAAERPLMLGAIDAGSNALRAAVAAGAAGGPILLLNRLRVPVRLGHGVFTGAALDDATIARAVDAFVRFRAMFDQYGTSRVRAVGTSALREAPDRRRLIDAVRAATGIELEPIDGAEEARLVRTAVLEAFPAGAGPELVADLGGGSLELSLLHGGTRVTSAVLPLGTVRLLETLELDGPLDAPTVAALRGRVLGALRAAFPRPPGPTARLALCGGNARTLSRILPGAPELGLPTLNIADLAAALPALCARTVDERIAAYQVGRDRAEVMAIAGVVIATLAEWLGAASLVVPGVGVLDGLLHELAALRRPCLARR